MDDRYVRAIFRKHYRTTRSKRNGREEMNRLFVIRRWKLHMDSDPSFNIGLAQLNLLKEDLIPRVCDSKSMKDVF